ncbi:MAG: SDR family oxidoreductase, partial [Gemmatimonadales bacterium]
TPLGRLAEADDVAQLIVFLCSDAARHITGEIIRVDGGQTLS